MVIKSQNGCKAYLCAICLILYGLYKASIVFWFTPKIHEYLKLWYNDD